MRNIKSYDSIQSIQNIEEKIVQDINILRNEDINFDVFFKYIFRDCCGCLDKECNIVELRDNNLSKIMRYSSGDSVMRSLESLDVESKVECNIIKIDIGRVIKKVYSNIGSISSSKIALAIRFIEMFKKSGLIRKDQDMYFLLNSNMRFKWNNIKRLSIGDIKKFKLENVKVFNELVKKYVLEIVLTDEEELLMIKSLFWYFRKVIVDSVVSDIIRLDNLNIKAMSVGSTKLSSDYDITLDGTYKDNSKVIKKFNRLMEIIFMDDSESVFDTNIYGVSFIKDKSRVVIGDKVDDKINNTLIKAFNKEHIKCGQFNYILSQEKDFIISQHIWAFIKLLLRLNKIQDNDEELYGLSLGELSKNFGDNLYYMSAVTFTNKYESNLDYYQSTVNDANRFLVNSGDNGSDYLVSNFISYVNYNGSETYLTSGAFLDVVVNNQICKNNQDNIVELDFNSYLDSFIENMADLMTHYHKEKYLKRASEALNNMLRVGEGFDIKAECNIPLKKKIYKDKEDKENKCKDSTLGEYVQFILSMIKKLQTQCSSDILECQSFIIIYYILYCVILVFRRYMEWSNITQKELNSGVNKFNDLNFKNFKVPIESKIREVFNE